MTLVDARRPDRCNWQDGSDPAAAANPVSQPVRWQSIDQQEDLDAMDRTVCWDDADLIEIHGGRGTWTEGSVDIHRRGVDALDYRVLLRFSGKETPYLELAFVECDAFNQSVFLEGLRGRVTTLMQVEIGRGFGGVRCSRMLYRWLQKDEVGKPHYWRDEAGPSGRHGCR